MKKTRLSTVFAAFLMGFAAFYAANYLLTLLTTLVPAVETAQDSYMDQYETIQSYQPALWADLFYSCIGAPFVEELVCRGLMWNFFKKHGNGRKVFIIASGVVFAVMHGNLYQMAFTLPLGMLLAYLICKSESLWPSFFLHASFNSSNYLVTIGSVLGFREGSDAEMIAYIAVVGFFLLCIPASVILLRASFGGRLGFEEKKPVAAEPSFGQNPAQEAPQRPVPPYGFSPEANPAVWNETEFGKGEFPMASPEYLVVGLGNPGEKYAQTRHNCGFLALDYLAARKSVKIDRLRFRALTGEVVLEGKKVLLMKPQTFMNLSGESVREAAAFYKIPPEKILVIFDDISFNPGVFRVRRNGSAGGHNGVKSIVENLASQEFPRIKMGIGAPPPGWDLMHWVLSYLPPVDQDRIIAEMEDIYSTVLHFLRDDLDRAASLYSGKEH
jgi:PTH1 family peptidyl-tRNA hydrolase